MQTIDTIVILDFGSQYTQLIARRIRELSTFSEILPPDTPYEEIAKRAPKGIILSGGPNSISENKIPVDPRIFSSPLPIMGICYGMHLLNSHHQGRVNSLDQGEYGKQNISLQADSPLFQNLQEQETVWMSHGDSVEALAAPFQVSATSESGIIAGIQHKTLPQYGVQFHPEVTHTKNGKQILENFLRICQCKREWTIENFIEKEKEAIRKKVGNGRVVSLVSGGVDSTAATFLCYEALGSDKVFPLHIDSGLMREGESAEVRKLLETHGMKNLVFVDASERFLTALRGVTDPEEKRKIIGELFIRILDDEIEKLDPHGDTTYFCQGTLYTDLVESGKGCGSHAAVIKTHHNVNPPIVEEKRKKGLIIEPNSQIFKDEVRQVCQKLGVPDHLTWRHPFPGPGLAIRILGEITPERLKTLRKADSIYLDEIRKAGLYSEIWQAFAVLLPVTTVGVMGDKRTTGNVVALRAVSSHDGMTADFSHLPMELFSRVSSRLINEVQGVNRVVYDITSKPPGTIEWE